MILVSKEETGISQSFGKLVGRATQLEAKISGLLLGNMVVHLAGQMAEMGCPVQYIADHGCFQSFVHDVYAKAIEEVCRIEKPHQFWLENSEDNLKLAKELNANFGWSIVKDFFNIGLVDNMFVAENSDKQADEIPDNSVVLHAAPSLSDSMSPGPQALNIQPVSFLHY